MSRRGENIYKRKDGRYEGRYVIGKTPAGRTRFGYVYARQYAEVRAMLLQRKAERLQADRPSSAYHGTLADWMERWMEDELLDSVKESSWQTYRNLLTRHLLPRLGGYALMQLTPHVVYEFVEELESSGLAESTVRGVYRLLSSAMRYALDEGVIRKNPCRRIHIQHREHGEQRVLNRSEQEKLRQTADDTRDLPALLSLYTGMRLGEICALKWTDIDWEQGTITVRRTVQRIAGRSIESNGQRTLLMIGSRNPAAPAGSFLYRSLSSRCFGKGCKTPENHRMCLAKRRQPLTREPFRGAFPVWRKSWVFPAHTFIPCGTRSPRACLNWAWMSRRSARCLGMALPGRRLIFMPTA